MGLEGLEGDQRETGSRPAKRWRSRARRRRNRAASSALRNALSGRRRLRRAPSPLELYWGEIA